MTTTNNNKKILDLKRWEVCNPAAIGRQVSSAVNIRHIKQLVFSFSTNADPYGALMYYDVAEDAWETVGNASTSGTGQALCITYSAWSTGSTLGASSLTATSGTTSTIVTNQTLARDLRGWKIHIMSGPNAGATLTISSNTIGANATITVPTQASAFSASTTFRLLTPRIYMHGGTSNATNIVRVYDYATNTNQGISTTNLTNPSSTNHQIWVSTPSWLDSDYLAFATGTATSATGTTLVNSAKTWTTNQWTNYQVRIVSGTGAGQIRTISSNTGDTLTVPTWTTTPDNTSTYSIEGNDDYLYLFVSGSTAVNRYSISNNSWTTMASRPLTSTGGYSGAWVYGAKTSDWTSETAIQNGRYIQTFGITSSSPSYPVYYDIPSNSWTTGSLYIYDNQLTATGAFCAYDGGNYIYYCVGAAAPRIHRYNVVTKESEPFTSLPYPGDGTATSGGNFAWIGVYVDGATTIQWLYTAPSGTKQLQRIMVV